jgi:hypothetical protein
MYSLINKTFSPQKVSLQIKSAMASEEFVHCDPGMMAASIPTQTKK